MASLILGLAGAAVGSTFGMASLGWMVGSALGNALGGQHPTRQPDQEGPRLTDTTVQASSYGIDVAQLFGTIRSTGNVIWSSNRIETRHVTEQSSGGGSSGGKGIGGSSSSGGGVTNIITYTYHVNMAVAICEGEIIGISRIWANGKLIYDQSAAGIPAGLKAANASSTGFTFYLGTEDQMPDAFMQSWMGGGYPIPGYRGTAYVVMTNFQLEQYGNVVPNFDFEVVAQEAATTGSIVKHFCNSAGLDDSYLELSALIQPVVGYKIASRSSARAAIEPLANAFFFDAVQSNAQVKFVVRGNPTLAADIPEDDLAARAPGSKVSDQLQPMRKAEEELPQEIGIVFINKNNNYQQGSQYARRQTTSSKTRVKLDMPIVMLDSEATGIAHTLLHSAWIGRTGFKFSVGRKYAQLEPTDVIAVNKGGSAYPMRLTEKNESKPGIIEFNAQYEDVAQWQYTPNNDLDHVNNPTSFIQEPGPVDDPIIFGAPSNLSSSGFELWIAATSPDDDWGGCDVWVSSDDLLFKPIGRIHGRSVMGKLTAALPYHADPDTANTLSVDLSRSKEDLSTVSQDTYDRYESLVYLDGELLSYKYATPTSLYHYNLTTLHRGVFNTPIDPKPIDSPFLFVNELMLRWPYNPALLGDTLYFRFTSFNTHRLQNEDVAEVTSYEYVVGGSIAHPDNTSLVNSEVLADGRIRIFVVPLADPRIKRYEIREGAVWEGGTPIGTIVAPAVELVIPPKAVGSYKWHAKAVNDQGVYSLASVFTTRTIATPAAPTALTASSNGLFYVALAWTYAGAQTDRHDVSIYGSTTNDRGTAALLITLAPDVRDWRHVGLLSGQNWYYWILIHDNAGNPSAFYPASATAGTAGAATDDPASLLAILFGSITEAALDPDLVDAINSGGTAGAAVAQEIIDRQDADNLLASDITTTTARLDTGDYAAVKTQSAASNTTLNGLMAKYIMKVDVNGHVAGIELMSGSGATSITMLADKFLFVKPDGTGTPKQVMVLGTVGGVSTLGLDGNLIVDGSIVASRIDTRGLSIKDGSGNIVLQAGSTFLTSGNASTYIAAGAIQNAQIGGVIQSTDYSAGSAGWKIDKAGSAEFNTGIFRSTLMGGQTAYDTGTGFFMGLSSATYKMSLGSATNGFLWDGSVFTVRGDIIATGNIHANAVSDLAYSYNASKVFANVGCTWTDLISVSIAVSSGQAVQINCSATINHGNSIANPAIRLRRGSTTIYGTTNTSCPWSTTDGVMYSTCESQGNMGTANAFIFVDSPGAGTFTYTMQLTSHSIGAPSPSGQDNFISAQIMKR